MNILVINAGSSSMKYQLIDMDTEQVLAKGSAERLGIDGSKIEHKANGKSIDMKVDLPDHTAAFAVILRMLLDKDHGAVKSIDEIHAVGHRVVHGGERFTESAIIDDTVLEAIKSNIPLAPLHNPANLIGIRSCAAVMHNVPMVAVFDTAFHQTMPKKSFLYGLPYRFYTENRLRRYGFHGTSHRYVSRKAAELLGKPVEELKIIVAHLGNGCSLCAVDGGKSVDTSMGLTPLEGVLMGTRAGDMDPAITQYLTRHTGLTVDEATDIYNKESGLWGLSGVSSDWRDVVAAANEGNEQAMAARDVFVYRVQKYIGAYAAAMNGLDVLVLTAGLGEYNYPGRKYITSNLGFLGIEVDDAKNQARETFISTENSRVKVMIVPTNEELAIARDTLALVGNRG